MLCKRDICQNIGIKRTYICLFDDNSPAGKDTDPPCALVCLTLHGNVYVHDQKRAGDKYQCNEMDNNCDYFQCPATKLFLIMHNDVFHIILICEINKVDDFIKFLSKMSN